MKTYRILPFAMLGVFAGFFMANQIQTTNCNEGASSISETKNHSQNPQITNTNKDLPSIFPAIHNIEVSYQSLDDIWFELREPEQRYFLQRLAQQHPEQAIAFIESRYIPKWEKLKQYAYTQWTKSDPLAALSWLEQQKNSGSDTIILSTGFLAGLAQQDLLEAWDYWSENYSGDTGSKLIETMIFASWYGNEDVWVELVSSIDDKPTFKSAIEEILKVSHKKEPFLAYELLQQAEKKLGVRQGLYRAIDDAYRSGNKKLREELSKLESPYKPSSKFIESIAHAMVLQDPHKAYETVASGSIVNEKAMNIIAFEWPDENLDELTHLLSYKMEDRKAADHAFYMLFQNYKQFDLKGGVKALETFHDSMDGEMDLANLSSLIHMSWDNKSSPGQALDLPVN